MSERKVLKRHRNVLGDHTHICGEISNFFSYGQILKYALDSLSDPKSSSN